MAYVSSGLVDDCAGECNGSAVEDCSGECNGSAVVDCAGDYGGSAVFDECGVCDGSGIAEGACDRDGALPEENFDCSGNCLNRFRLFKVHVVVMLWLMTVVFVKVMEQVAQ